MQTFNELTKESSRAVWMLFKIKQFCTPSALKSLYYSLFHSDFAYGLVLWENASKTDIGKIRRLQKRAFCAISKRNEEIDIKHYLSTLKVLDLDDLLELQLSSLMWDYDHNCLPSSLKELFKRSNTIHQHGTRGAIRGSLHHTKINTMKYGYDSFRYKGRRILNNLKQLSIYHETKSKSLFTKKFKTYILSKHSS